MDHRLAGALGVQGNAISQPRPAACVLRPVVWRSTASTCSPRASSSKLQQKRMRSRAVSCNSAAAAAAAAAAPAAEEMSFGPSVWGDFFINHEPQLQKPEEWMRERANKLKKDVRSLFATSKDILERMYLVDAIQHLGIDHLFQEEIEAALQELHATEFTSSNLHDVALRFHMLRERGYWVSPDVFNIFKGDDGSFRNDLTDDPRGLLSLYNAAHLFIHGEPELEEVISFARHHLESISRRGVLKGPLANQVKRALHLPLPRTHRRVEMLDYVNEYDQEDGHNPDLLELAKLDFNILQKVHLKELKEISRWWKDITEYMGLTHIRDRVVESYFWSYSVYHEEELSLARIIFAKVVVIIALMDDTYDVHAFRSIEECRALNAAIQGWDESALLLVPDYLRKMYEVFLTTFKEFEEQAPANQKYLVGFTKSECQKLSNYYLEGAEWSYKYKNVKPSFKDQVELSTMTTGTRPLAAGLMIAMDYKQTKDAYEWAVTSTDSIISCGKTGRFMNDIAGFQLGSQNGADMPCSVECYINEYNVPADVAIAKINELVEDEWKTTNQSRIDHRPLLPVVQRLINITMAIPVFYLNGSDGFTFGNHLQKILEKLLVKPIPM